MVSRPTRLIDAALETPPPPAYSPGMDGIAAKELYERDFHAWTQDQAERLRALAPRNDGVDIPNIAEEIESLGRSQRAAVRGLMALVMVHLLKLRFHPDQRWRDHWLDEVDAFRGRIRREMEDSPSLRAARHDLAAAEWRGAARDFLRRMERDGHDPRRFRALVGDPDQPYFDLDAEVLNEDWFPVPPA